MKRRGAVGVWLGAFWFALAASAWGGELALDGQAEQASTLAAYGCFACHGGATEAQRALLDERQPPRLAGDTPVGERVNRAWAEAFLADPRGTRPHTTHPHELAALPPGQRAAVAADLAAFLFRGAAPNGAPSTSSAAELERGRALFHSVGCVACHVPEEPADDLAWTLADWNRFDEAADVAADDAAADGDAADGDAADGDAAGAAQAAGGAAEQAAPFVPPGTLAPGVQPIPADLAAKFSRESLAAFLADPLAVRPSGHMPDMALGLADARAVAAYLLRDAVMGAAGRFVEAPGLLLTAETHARGNSAATPADLPEAATSTTRVVAGVDIAHKPADDRFALRYDGILTAPVAGEYTFHVMSDDGSWLDLDGARIIDNGGVHAPSTKSAKVTLTEGAHTFALVMFENAGGEDLTLEWEAPGGERGPVPADRFTHWAVEYPGLDAAGRRADLVNANAIGDADRGLAAFVSYGCAQCHTDVEFGMVARAKRAATPKCVTGDNARYALPEGALAALFDLGAPGSKPGSKSGSKSAAKLEAEGVLAPAGFAAWVAGLEASPAARVEHVLEQRSCLLCHRRDDVGGVHPERKGYFQGDASAELGDEGRYPPHLTRIGRKLNDGALARALAGDERARPYTTTRMPKFGLANVGGLVPDFAAADRGAVAGGASAAGPVEPEAPAALPANAVQVGRRLAGIQDGLGCVQCHDFLGTPSLGVRAVDLGKMHTRVRWPWFRDLLIDPTSVNMNTRMTAVFVDGKSPVHDVFDGDPEQQVAALWAFLAQEDNMAPPPGIRTSEAAYELEAYDAVRMVGVFMRDVSPRVLCIGTPAGVHFAWDLEHGRLAKLWRGRFMNVRGTWEGRAGALESPPSSSVLVLPPGPSISLDAGAAGAWPAAGTPRQRRYVPTDDDILFSAQHPLVVTYDLGEGEVKESFRPREDSAGGAPSAGRHVAFVTLGKLPEGLAVRLAVGASIEPLGEYTWRVTGPTPHTIVIDRLSTEGVSGIAPRFVLVHGAEGDELRVVVELTPEGRALEGALFDVSWSIQW
ncbi:MAG: PA14 domain-containing protein [Planctomycetota bacterium]